MRPGEVPLVSGADVEAAAELLAGVVRHTPLEHSRGLADRVGGPVWLKCENLQRTGSFKIRGAYMRISRLTDGGAGPRRGRGQRRQPRAGRRAGRAGCSGATATVFMPEGAPMPKVAATRAYGAEVAASSGRPSTRRWSRPRSSPSETGAVLIHPFDHPDIVAGQGTVGLEILEQCPDVAHRRGRAGGGGLLAGIAAAVKALRPDVRVVGVQAEGAAAFPASLAAGRPVAAGRDGDDGRRHRGRPRRARCRSRRAPDWSTRSRTVSEEDLSRALLFCLERAKLVVEPAGAAAVAALLDDPARVRAAGGRGALRRQHRPAAAAAGDPARHGRRRPLPVAAAAGPRPAGRAGRAARRAGRRSGPTCSRSSTSGPTPRLHLDEVEVACAWRPAAPSTRDEVRRGAARARATPVTLRLSDRRARRVGR